MPLGVRSGLAPLVGRGEALAAIEGMVAKLGDGMPGCLAIVGEPGIGKTRLLRELAIMAQAQGVHVLAGRASELEQVPFAPIVDALDDCVPDLDVERLTPDRAAELGRIFPSLGGGGERASAALPIERYRLHHAVRAALGELAAARPTALLLDDLQWADDASVELIAHLVRRPPRGPLLLALAYRTMRVPRQLVAAIASAERSGAIARLDLDPLTAPEAAELVAGTLDAAQRSALYRDSGGNPFYLESLARRLGAQPPARPPTGDGATSGQTQVPSGVLIAIEDELTKLSGPAHALLQAAAATGDPFDLDVAAAVAELPEPAALRALDELVEHELARVTDTPRRYVFRHPIVRRAVYESAGDAWRHAAHARAADVLASRGATAARRAHHVEQSARPGDESAITLLTEAAAESAARAPGVAARWYAAALRMLPDDATSERRLGLLVPLAVAFATVGRLRECHDALAEALALVPESLPEVRARIIVHMARADVMDGRHGPAQRLIADALEAQTDPGVSTMLRLELAAGHWYASEMDEMIAATSRARDEAIESGEKLLRAEASSLLSVMQQYGGGLEAAIELADEAEAIVAGFSDEQLALRLEGLLFLGFANQSIEHFESATTHIERAVRIARTSGQGHFFVTFMTNLALTYLPLGRVREASETAEAAVEAALLLRIDQPLMGAMMARARTCLAEGNLDAADDFAQQGAIVARRRQKTLYGPLVRCTAGMVMIEGGDLLAGRAEILEGGGGADLADVEPSYRPYWLAVLADGDIARGALEDAELWVQRAEGLATRLGLQGRIGLARRARASLLLARDEPRRAAEVAEQAARELRSVRMLIEAARAQALHGRALILAGDEQTGGHVLERARAELVACGAGGYVPEVDRGVRPGSRRAGQRFVREIEMTSTTLSARELEVAQLVVSGLTNRAVAEALFLSPKTVETHLAHIYEKLGIASRAALPGALKRVGSGVR
jgi:DNA-binding CsgD family transcriptional regulator/tetratricopeptide (TPR) repeat protein